MFCTANFSNACKGKNLQTETLLNFDDLLCISTPTEVYSITNPDFSRENLWSILGNEQGKSI
eukprot:scaffold222419_cov31-Prasinocladus_malaysianus.AAC.1